MVGITIPYNKKGVKIIHVNRANIAFNAKWGEAILPTYIIRHKGQAIYAHSFTTEGLLEAADPRKRKQLACGARAWLETYGKVDIEEAMSYKASLQLKEAYLSEQVSGS